jgi:threonine synthase
MTMPHVRAAAHGPAAHEPLDLPTRLACAGCGWRARPGDIVLRCPAAIAGDDVDHVVTRTLDPAVLRMPRDAHPNPFVRYRTLFHAYHVALAAGWSDADYVALVERIDAAIAAVDGRGFRVTPFVRSEALGTRLGLAGAGGVFVKDETGNVSGSHKARHLMATMLALEVADAVGGDTDRRPLAIASCGNAAMAAAVVARAAGRTLDVFIPPDAPASVVARLRDLGARLTVCRREPGQSGDPSYRALLDAIEGGSIPFTCQGNLNGLAIEGGETLGWEIIDQARDAGGTRLDRLVVQVGGGALASGCVRAFADARLLSEPVATPRIHAVQTRGAYPLARAYARLADRARRDGPAAIAEAARHRSAFMWPWEQEPRSIAHGILDDETYDWLAVATGMLESGGGPLVVDEESLVEANRLARDATGIDVDHTGSAGLAGLMELVRRGEVDRDERVVVLFTGARREGERSGT